MYKHLHHGNHKLSTEVKKTKVHIEAQNKIYASIDKGLHSIIVKRLSKSSD